MLTKPPAALLLLSLFGCGHDGVEARPPTKAGATATAATGTDAAVSTAATTAAAPMPPRSGTVKLDVDLEGENALLAVVFSRAGHLLFATQRGLWDWDPSGVEKTKQLASTPEALFGPGARAAKAEFPDRIAVVPPKGTAAEEWLVRATFSGDAAFAAFYAESAAFAELNHFNRQKFVTTVLRTDTGASVGTFTKILRVDSAPEYAFGPHLSPGGRFLAVQKPFQLEVFEVATGRSALQRLSGGFGDETSFLSDTTLLRSRLDALDVVNMETGRVVRSQRSASTYAVSPDRGSVAILDKGTVRFWNVATGTVTAGCKNPQKCEYCTVEWTDATHVRLFDESAKKTEVVCPADATAQTPSVAAYVARPVFQGEGFSVVEHVDPGASQPSRVVVTVPKGGKDVTLAAGRMAYSASHGRLLVQGDNLRLIDAAGDVRELTKAR